MKTANILEVKNLFVSYEEVNVVRDVSFSLSQGEFLGVVGESGCGKSTMLRALMALRQSGSHFSGSICFRGRELTQLSEKELCQLRGADISMIPQNAADAMDAVKTVSALFRETMRVHGRRLSRRESDRIAAELMQSLLLEDAERILRSYPFELSGGMCQRVMIALAMVNHPQLILADEPTSALDIASQMEVLRQLKRLKESASVSMVMISHNLGALAAVSDTIAVMYGGRIVEYGDRDSLLKAPAHPYTRALIDAVPDMEGHISKGLPGTPPPFEKKMQGCPFAGRCPHCRTRCLKEIPGDTRITGTHRVQCFRKGE